MKPYWNVLTINTQILYKRLFQLSFISKFYLAGGTGLFIQIGHHFSVDLDFFADSSEAVGDNQRKIILSELTDDPSLSLTWNKDWKLARSWCNFLSINPFFILFLFLFIPIILINL